MRLESYMKDYPVCQSFDKDRSRSIGKAMFSLAGLIATLIGIFCIPYSAIGGIIVTLGGIFEMGYALIYYRKV